MLGAGELAGVTELELGGSGTSRRWGFVQGTRGTALGGTGACVTGKLVPERVKQHKTDSPTRCFLSCMGSLSLTHAPSRVKMPL